MPPINSVETTTQPKHVFITNPFSPHLRSGNLLGPYFVGHRKLAITKPKNRFSTDAVASLQLRQIPSQWVRTVVAVRASRRQPQGHHAAENFVLCRSRGGCMEPCDILKNSPAWVRDRYRCVRSL